MSTITLDRYSVGNTFDNHRDHRIERHLHAVPDAAPATHLRLTARGKVVVMVAAVAVIALLVIMFGSSTAATDQAGNSLPTTTVTVMPDTTLWQIAATANPNGDIRKTVDEIVRLNSLPNASALQMGSEIAVPIYK